MVHSRGQAQSKDLRGRHGHLTMATTRYGLMLLLPQPSSSSLRIPLVRGLQNHVQLQFGALSSSTYRFMFDLQKVAIPTTSPAVFLTSALRGWYRELRTYGCIGSDYISLESGSICPKRFQVVFSASGLYLSSAPPVALRPQNYTSIDVNSFIRV